MNKENFKDWIVFKPDWNEIGWQYNTGKRYQNKQDLIAVFWNSYIYLQQKFEAYHSKYEKVPHDYFKELIFKFRQKFPKNGRIEGINYYDDLIEQLLEKYSQPQPVKESETLSELITHQNSVEIVEKIKIQYKNIKGKSLKLLLMAFQDLDLLPKERIALKFHKACKNEFKWNIASYNAMNGHNYNDRAEKEELEQKKSYLKSIIELK